MVYILYFDDYLNMMVEKEMLENVVYISSDDRSGSTMLDLILANSPEVFAAGELHNLPACVFNDRSFWNPSYEMTCMCGKTIQECDFWQDVEKELPVPFNQLRLRVENPALSGVAHYLNDKFCAIDWRIRTYFPQMLKNKFYQKVTGGRAIARNYFHLYEAIAKVSGRKLVVDSSKWPFRFRFLYDFNPEKVKIILLYRNPKAVVYSKMKRGEVLEKSAIKWNNMAIQMELFSSDVPDKNKILVKYEELCRYPKKTISRICSFLGIEFRDNMTKLKKVGIHHIGGSPSKFDLTRTRISVDKDFKNKLTNSNYSLIELLTPEAKSKDLYGDYIDR